MNARDQVGMKRMIARDGKILRREDAKHYFDARQVLHDAKLEAAHMIEAAQEQIEQQRLAGYAEGLRAGRRDQAQLMAHAVITRDRYLANAEPELGNLLIAAIRKIFADFDDGEKTRIIVHKALSALRAQTQVLLRVHPAQYDDVKREVAHFKTLFPNLEVLEVVPDDAIAECACVMSSELGAVETNIEAQIDALTQAIAETMGQSSAIDETAQESTVEQPTDVF